MQNLDKQLQISYYKNMEFFKAYNQKLFNALASPPQSFNLHLDSKGLNIINLYTGALQYPSEGTPDKNSMLLAHEDLAKDPLRNPKWHMHYNFSTALESNFIDEDKLPLTGRAYNDMLKLAIPCIAPDRLDLESDALRRASSLKAHSNVTGYLLASKYLPPTTIYGLMGGLFLQNLLENDFRFHSLLIYEENLDLFRISLYFLDYARLFGATSNRCLLVIGRIEPRLIKAFLATKRLSQNLLRLELSHYTSQNTQNLKSLIFKEGAASLRGWGSFEDEKVGLENALENLASAPLIPKGLFDSPAVASQNPKKLSIPICVVGSGSSLDSCLEFIRQNASRLIIFSCGTALGVLNHHGITPDFQIEIERVPYLGQVLKEAGLGAIPLIFAQTTDTGATRLARSRLAFMRGGSASAYLDSKALVLEFSAPFVGNAGVALACLLSREVILCGLDCGFVRGFSKHARHSFYGDEATSLPPNCFKVAGNKLAEVYSNDLFYLSAQNISQAIAFYKPHRVLNLGSGARIEGASSFDLENLMLENVDKDAALRELKSCFSYFSPPKQNLKAELGSFASEFFEKLDGLLDRDIDGADGLYELLDRIEGLLQSQVAISSKRAGLILFEGSVMHLSFGLFLSSLFTRGESYSAAKGLFIRGLRSMLSSFS